LDKKKVLFKKNPLRI